MTSKKMHGGGLMLIEMSIQTLLVQFDISVGFYMSDPPHCVHVSAKTRNRICGCPPLMTISKS